MDPTLTASIGGKKQPLLQQTVTFTLIRPGVTKTFSTITDYLGRATLPPTGVSPGLYLVTASFAGDATYTAAIRPSVLLISAFTGFLSPVKNPPNLNSVNGGSTVPVRFSLGGFRGLAIFAPGNPRVRHDQLHHQAADRSQLRARARRAAQAWTTTATQTGTSIAG